MAFFSSSIGKKIIMAITGFLLFGFVLNHMAGNLLFFVGKDAYNMYGYKLTHIKPLYYTIEVILLSIFVGHILNSVVLTLKNRQARGTSYRVKSSLGKRSWASSNMFVSGSIVFIFLIIHIVTFRFGEAIYYTVDGTEGVRDLYTIVIHAFRYEWLVAGIPFYTLFYILAVGLLGFHLKHGFQSIFKSFGLYHKEYSKKMDLLSSVLSVIIVVGFLSVPVYFGLINKGDIL